jgi:hypothetical protein
MKSIDICLLYFQVKAVLAASGIPLFLPQDDVSQSELNKESISFNNAIFSLAAPWLESMLDWTSNGSSFQFNSAPSAPEEWQSFAGLHSLIFQSLLHGDAQIQTVSAKLLCKSLVGSVPQNSSFDPGLRVLLTLSILAPFHAALVHAHASHASKLTNDCLEQQSLAMTTLTQWLALQYPQLADSFLQLASYSPSLLKSTPKDLAQTAAGRVLRACIHALLGAENIADSSRQDIGFLVVGALIRFLAILTSDSRRFESPLPVFFVEALCLSLIHALQQFEVTQRRLYSNEALRAHTAQLCLRALSKELDALTSKLENLKLEVLRLQQAASEAEMRAVMYQQVADGIGEMLHHGRLADISSPQRMVDIIAKQKIEVDLLKEQARSFFKYYPVIIIIFFF